MAVETMVKFTADTSQASEAIDGIVQKEQQLGKEKTKISVDTSSAEHAIEGLKEKSKDILSGVGAGALAGGAFIGIEKGIDAQKELLESQNKLKVAVAQTGDTQAQVNAKFSEAEGLVGDLSEEFKKPQGEVRNLVSQISGIGGIGGEQRKKIAEIGIAFQDVGVPAKALKKILLGVNDPETAAAFDALKTQFPQLQTAIAGATTSQEKLDAISGVVGGKLDQIKENAKGPTGQIFDLQEATEKSEQAFGGLILGALTPILPLLTALASVVVSVSGFLTENKTAVIVAASAYGLLRLSMAAKEVGGFGPLIKDATKGAIDFGKSIVEKLVPGLLTKAAVETEGAVATEGATVAQQGLNSAVKANPLGLFITIVGAVITAVVFLYDKVGFVKKAVDALGGAVKSIGSALGLYTESVDKNTDALEKNNEASKVAAEKANSIADAYTKAKDAYDKYAAGVADTESKEEKDVRQEVDNANAVIQKNLDKLGIKAAQFKKLKDSDSTWTEGQKALVDEISKNIDHAADAQTRLNEITSAKTEAGKLTSTAPEEKKKAVAQNLLAIAKTNAEEKAKEYEIDLKISEQLAGREFSKRDELAVQKKLNEEFQNEIDKQNVLVGIANQKKYGAKVKLEDKVLEDKTLSIQAQIKIDDKKTQQELNKSIDGLKTKQIEVGILPKSAGLSFLDSQIDRIRQRIVVLNAQGILNGFDKKTVTEINDLNSQVLGLEKDRNDKELQLSDELTAARIANITDETERALAERGRQLEKDLQFVRDAAGRELNAHEKALQLQIELKYQFDVAKIRTDARQKNYNEELDLERNLKKIAFNDLLSALREEFDAKKQFNQLEYEDKLESLDKEQTALERSLAKGEISQRDYQTKLGLIAQKRTDAEKNAEDSKNSAILAFTKKATGSILDNTEKYIQGVLQKYVFEKTVYGQTKQQEVDFAREAAAEKAAADAAAAAVATGASQEEVTEAGKAAAAKVRNSNIAVAAQQKDASGAILSAATTALSSAIASLPFPINIAAGLGASFAVTEAFKGLKSLLGFEKGGIGVVGEKGPEIIGPTKDFSQMVTLLVSSTAQEVRRSMSSQFDSGSARSKGPLRVQFSGTTRNSGRDMVTTFNQEALATRNERLVPA